ncbi:MAG: rRNA adenine N-6-methyltransferase family protein [Anaerolineales bacterium]
MANAELEWEAAWAAYDDATYQAALDFLLPDDLVLDIGAGDLRFARLAAARAQGVIAIERRAELLSGPHSSNLKVICGDALCLAFPRGVTVGVLLMRHCCHFTDYVSKLRVVGCERLITNARWGMDVESLSLAPQPPFAEAVPGWYACLCGAAGFKPLRPEAITTDLLTQTQSVESCPGCHPVEAWGGL